LQRVQLFLPCSLQGYRLRCLCPDAMQHGRSVLQPLESLSRTWAAATMHCRPGTLQSSGVSIGARHASPLRSRSSKLAKVPDQRSTTTRRYRPSGLQERVRRVVLHRIRDTHAILADQWRHECDANLQPQVRQFRHGASTAPSGVMDSGLAAKSVKPTCQRPGTTSRGNL
jgi:hypothetical protein